MNRILITGGGRGKSGSHLCEKGLRATSYGGAAPFRPIAPADPGMRPAKRLVPRRSRPTSAEVEPHFEGRRLGVSTAASPRRGTRADKDLPKQRWVRKTWNVFEAEEATKV